MSKKAISVSNEATNGLVHSTVVDLAELTANPSSYGFFKFRPHVEKLMLAGTAEAKHISILWYTVPDGGVGRHYHSMTESVYTIEGRQTDAQGVYSTGSLCFNPPGSGHEIVASTGFFILAYASPPDFVNTDLIKAYTPIHIDTANPHLENNCPFYPFFADRQAGLWIYDVPLAPQSGISCKLNKSTSAKSYLYQGNYLQVLRGSCEIDGTTFGEQMLVVSTTVEPRLYKINASENNTCLVLGLSFL